MHAGKLSPRLTGRTGPLHPQGQHSRKALAPAPDVTAHAGTGTFHPGVLMSSRNRIQSLRRTAYQAQAGHCYYCGARMWLRSPTELSAPQRSPGSLAQLQCTAEHLKAQCDGGKHSASNVVAACARCNRGRHRLRNPPDPSAYREHVVRRLARNGWHERWVHEVGLLSCNGRGPLQSKPRCP